MSLLSRLLHRVSGSDNWYVKVDLISELSEIARRYWCEEWSAGGSSNPADDSAAAPEAKALRMLQARLMLRFIADQGYLRPAEQPEFSNFLHRALIGPGAQDDPLFARYAEPEDDGSELFRRFAADYPVCPSARLIETLPQFALEQNYVVALAFKDSVTARRLKAEIEASDA